VAKVKASAGKYKHATIGCLGLAFKADVDDLRESPALEIVQRIQAESLGEVLVAEPNLARHKEFTLLPYEEVVARADIVVVLVDHKQFRKLRATDLKEKIVIDTRGIVT
jgi:UDP-N-acetyl-D-mannosaminuronic acid dehydrogenase